MTASRDGSESNEHERRGFAGRMLDSIVGTVASPVVSAVDVDDVVARIDVDDVVARIDVDALLQRVDVNALLDRIEPDALLDRVDMDRVLDRVDVNGLLDRIEPDALLDRVDPNRLLDRVDPDRLLDRVDANALLDRVDPDRLLDRVDPDRLLDRVDPDRLLDRVDVNRLVDRTELRSLIARSTTGVFTEVLDLVRARILVLDQVVHGLGRRIAARQPAGQGPGAPGQPDHRPELRGRTTRDRAVALQGQFAGAVSRFLAFVVDQILIGLLFTAGGWIVATATVVVLGHTPVLDDHRWLVAVAYAIWAFAYVASQLALAGRTVGKAMLGLLVVERGGAVLRGRTAVVRTLCFPISFLLFGIGFLLGLVRQDRRQLHDLLAGSAVIYAWDAETARLRAESRIAPASQPTP